MNDDDVFFWFLAAIIPTFFVIGYIGNILDQKKNREVRSKVTNEKPKSDETIISYTEAKGRIGKKYLLQIINAEKFSEIDQAAKEAFKAAYRLKSDKKAADYMLKLRLCCLGVNKYEWEDEFTLSYRDRREVMRSVVKNVAHDVARGVIGDERKARLKIRKLYKRKFGIYENEDREEKIASGEIDQTEESIEDIFNQERKNATNLFLALIIMLISHNLLYL